MFNINMEEMIAKLEQQGREDRKRFIEEVNASFAQSGENCVFSEEDLLEFEKATKILSENKIECEGNSNIEAFTANWNGNIEKSGPELRMYFFVMYNLSGIQKGIQSAHALAEYGEVYGERKLYKEWVQNHKTIIVLDGGGSQQMGELEFELEERNIEYASFLEPDLNHSISAIAFILPEDIYNFNENRAHIQLGQVFNLYRPMPTNEERAELAEEERKYEIFKWIKSFKLARN